MSDKGESNYRNFLILFTLISIALVLASSVGFFDGIISVSEKIQSNYRIKINSSISKVNDLGAAVYDIAKVKRDRDQYRSDVIKLQSKVTDLQSKLDAANVAGLQSKTEFASKYNLIPADVIRYKPEEPGTMVINKGDGDGVKNGDILIVKNYAVGELIDVHKYTSTVRTLKSGDSKVLVISNKGVKGVLYARGGRELWVQEVLSDADVKPGDTFTTLGVNSNFVPNLFVGEVVDVQITASSTTKELKLKNDLGFNNLREVYILHHEN